MVELLEKVMSMYIAGGGEISKQDLKSIPMSEYADIGDETVRVQRFPPFITRHRFDKKVRSIRYHMTIRQLTVFVDGENGRMFDDFPPDEAIAFLGCDDPDEYYFANIDGLYGYREIPKTER